MDTKNTNMQPPSMPIEQPNQENIPQNVSKSSKNNLLILFIIIAMFIIGAVAYFLVAGRTQKTGQSNKVGVTTSPTVSRAPQTGSDDFFLFSIPKPLQDLTIFQLPNTMSPRNVVQYKDSLWFAGGGSLVEYDTKSGKLVSYSNLTKANCNSNVVIANDYIFTSCYTDNINDAFGKIGQPYTSKIYTGRYSVYKINPLTHQIEYVFTDKDGLQSRNNYYLVADGDTVWIQTFKGIGRIDVKTNKVSFYPDSQIDITFGAGKIIPDKDYVWAYSEDKGFALFDKATQTWRKFTSTEVSGKTDTYGRIDTRPFGNAAKLVQGGLQVGMYVGENAQDNCMIRQYTYSTQQWSTVSKQQKQYIYQCNDELEKQFPKEPMYSKVDSNGLTQIQLPGSNKQYQLDGRDNYILSPMLGNKRYILTSATVDVIDESSPFRQILMKLGSLPSSGVSYGDPSAYEGLVHFLIDPDNQLAVVTDSSCGGQGCSGKEKVWFIDLKSAKIRRVYTKADGINGEQLYNLSMNKEGNLLIIKDKNGKSLFSIDTTNNNLAILTK